MAKSLLKQAKERKVKLILPVDHVVAAKVEAGALSKITSIQETPIDWMGLDIGPETIKRFKEHIQPCQDNPLERSSRGF